MIEIHFSLSISCNAKEIEGKEETSVVLSWVEGGVQPMHFGRDEVR